MSDDFPIGKRTSTAFMLGVFALSWLYPLWPYEQALHASLTLVGFALLWRYTARWQLGNREFFFIALFFAIHSVAGRWLYSYVPYDRWTQWAFHVSLSEQMGWTRNHFDRLVHFMFGVCFTPAIAAWAARRARLQPVHAFLAALTAIMVVSLWYEWFEWLIAMTMSGKDAEAYNGQQGDMWDAHKDMLMATLGSLCWMPHYRRVSRRAPHGSAIQSFT